MRKIVHLSTFDSFLRANKILSDYFGSKGVEVTHIILDVRMDQISNDQIGEILEGYEHQTLKIQEAIDLLTKMEFEWIILSAENRTCRRFFDLFSRARFDGARPLVATIYPGILFRYHYDGFSARSPADLVLLNSRADCRNYRQLASALALDSGECFELGPITSIGSSCFKRNEGSDLVVFFDQPSVPSSKVEKMYIFEQLSILADSHPKFRFGVKLRISPNQTTLHKGGHRTLDYLDEFNKGLASGRRKLELVSGSAREVISDAHLCLSVSSTALVEAISCGVPSVAITDFGIDEDYGGNFFVGSGICRSLDELNLVDLPALDDAWRVENLPDVDGRLRELYLKMQELYAEHEKSPFVVRGIHPAYGSKNFFEQAVAKHGYQAAIARN
jgi:hypothetical protein